MTYNVFGGMLKLAQPNPMLWIYAEVCLLLKVVLAVTKAVILFWLNFCLVVSSEELDNQLTYTWNSIKQ